MAELLSVVNSFNNNLSMNYICDKHIYIKLKNADELRSLRDDLRKIKTFTASDISEEKGLKYFADSHKAMYAYIENYNTAKHDNRLWIVEHLYDIENPIIHQYKDIVVVK